MIEEWRDIPGFEGRYQASTEGRIRSTDKICTHKGRVLKTCIGSNGYPYVGVWAKGGKNAKYTPVHHLVALTFLGERPQGYEICHADGNKQNNRLTNLRYASRTENRLDVYRNGGRYSNLYPDQVREIRKLLEEKQMSQRAIGELYGISVTSIQNIKTGRRFSWLK